MNEHREITLTVRSERGEVLAVLAWQKGATEVRQVKSTIAGTVQRWIDHGLDEWVGEGDASEPRTTPSSAPEFLARLEDHLARQFSFRLRLDTVVQQARPASVVRVRSRSRMAAHRR
jgi:hypothetical protein